MLRLLCILLTSIFLFNTLSANTQKNISDYLHSSKEHYTTILSSQENSQEIHFVMGNESADLDSIFSSISYAYLLNSENKDQIYIPLLNMYREELSLRKDTLYLIELLNISPDDLLFLDDNVPLDLLFSQNRLRFNLVDHNVLRPRQEHLSPAVERIVDHHADENKEYPLLTQENKEIVIVGSAATLIAEKMLSNPEMVLTPELSTMLLAPILIDTSNLQSLEKTTEKDIHAVEMLQSLADGFMPEGFYEKLLAAKNDISGLTPAMLLSKDFKEYLDGELLYGISSIPSSVSWWAEDIATIKPILEKYASERELSFLILLMANNDPEGPKRKIIVYSLSPELMQGFVTYVQADEALNKILIPGPVSNDDQVSLYWTEKLIARKQLQPLFHFSQISEVSK